MIDTCQGIDSENLGPRRVAAAEGVVVIARSLELSLGMGDQASRAIAFIEAIGLLDLISNCIKSHRIASNRIESHRIEQYRDH
jgi:hypothetical protein